VSVIGVLGSVCVSHCLKLGVHILYSQFAVATDVSPYLQLGSTQSCNLLDVYIILVYYILHLFCHWSTTIVCNLHRCNWQYIVVAILVLISVFHFLVLCVQFWFASYFFFLQSHLYVNCNFLTGMLQPARST
jgi:hypothetical protein